MSETPAPSPTEFPVFVRGERYHLPWSHDYSPEPGLQCFLDEPDRPLGLEAGYYAVVALGVEGIGLTVRCTSATTAADLGAAASAEHARAVDHLDADRDQAASRALLRYAYVETMELDQADRVIRLGLGS